MNKIRAIFVAVALMLSAGLFLADPALAANGSYLDCSYHQTTTFSAQYDGVWYRQGCYTTLSGGSNSLKNVIDVYHRICVYFGTTLAGCANPNQAAYVGNRVGQQAIIRVMS